MGEILRSMPTGFIKKFFGPCRPVLLNFFLDHADRFSRIHCRPVLLIFFLTMPTSLPIMPSDILLFCPQDC